MTALWFHDGHDSLQFLKYIQLLFISNLFSILNQFSNFTESAVQQEPVQFNTPEPYRQTEEAALNEVNKDEKPGSVKSTLWQTLNDRTTSKKPANPTTNPLKIQTATDRIDMDYSDISHYIQQNQNSVFRPNLVPSIPHPKNGLFSPQLTPDNNIKQIDPPLNGDKLMSPFLKAPPPRNINPQPPQPRIPAVQWADPSGFIPSQINNNLRTEELSVVVTPLSQRPNTIPMTLRPVLRPKQTTTTTKKPQFNGFNLPTEKFTAQQIIRQQMLNRRKQQDDMDGAHSSDQFWLTLQNRGQENLQKFKDGLPVDSVKQNLNHMLFDTIADMNKLNNKMKQQDQNQPKIQFENILPTTSTTPEPRIMVTPARGQILNQFMLKEQLRQKQIEQQTEKTNIQVFNPGSSGLQVVSGAVPLENNDQIFSVGSSLSFGNGGSESSTISNNIVGSTITLQPEVGVYPKGDDPHILHGDQIQAGTPLPQGPHGPLIPKPRPTSFPVTQTPRAPQVLQTLSPGSNFSPVTRKVGGGPVQGSHQIPGPGNYNPPLDNTKLPGLPGSGQQLIKHFLLHNNEQRYQEDLIRQQEEMIKAKKIQEEMIKQKQFQEEIMKQQKKYQEEMMQKKHQEEVIKQQKYLEEMAKQQKFQEEMAKQQKYHDEMAKHQHLQELAKQHNINMAMVQNQQTVLPNNVLQHRNNAPTPIPISRRQDLLGDVLPSAAVGALASGLTPISIFSNLLNAYATLDSKHDITGKIVEGASALFNPSPKEAQITEKPEPKSSTTENSDNNDGNYDAVIVDAVDLPPVRSNVDPDQPLRPKPPSEGVFRVTPAPNFQSYGQLGVQNPHFYSQNRYGPTTENYGPDDFVVETVKLDKDFFHQFFTSKPILIGTDVVTSKSVTTSVNLQKLPRKRTRKTSANLPDSLIDISRTLPEIASSSLLHKMALQHVEKRQTKPPTTTQMTTESPSTWTTQTTTFKPPTTTTTTTFKPLETTTKSKSVPKIINSVKTFTRYYIPPEVKISSAMVGSEK